MSTRRHPTRAKSRRVRRKRSNQTRTKARSNRASNYGYRPADPREDRLDYIMDQVASLVTRNLPRYRRG